MVLLESPRPDSCHTPSDSPPQLTKALLFLLSLYCVSEELVTLTHIWEPDSSLVQLPWAPVHAHPNVTCPGEHGGTHGQRGPRRWSCCCSGTIHQQVLARLVGLWGGHRGGLGAACTKQTVLSLWMWTEVAQGLGEGRPESWLQTFLSAEKHPRRNWASFA